MSVDNIETKCSRYGQGDDPHSKNRSTLRRPVVLLPGETNKPKDFDITYSRVDFSIRQLQSIKGFVDDLMEINNDLRKDQRLTSLF